MEETTCTLNLFFRGGGRKGGGEKGGGRKGAGERGRGGCFISLSLVGNKNVENRIIILFTG